MTAPLDRSMDASATGIAPSGAGVPETRLVASAVDALPRATGARTPAAWMERVALPARVRPFAFTLVVGIASRLFSSALLLLLPDPARHPPILAHQSGSPFLAWDAQWYLHIAATGYHTVPQQFSLIGRRYDFAFYPAWPGLIHGGSMLGLPSELVGVVLANVLFVLALVVVFAVLAERFDPGIARGAVLLLAFAPASYVASMAYSEPLFLLIVASYFAMRGSRYRPIAAALTVLTRVTGLAVLASAVVMAVRDPRERPRLIASAIGVVVAFAAWWDVVWAISRSPLGWLRGSPAWLPGSGLPDIARTLGQPEPWALAWLGVVALMIGLSLLLLRRDLELGVYSLAGIAMSVLGAPVSSMPRHTLIAFPAFAILAGRLGPRGTTIAAIVFAGLQAWFVWAAFGPPMAPP